MPSLGHGISEAVRNHIPIWIDDALVDILYAEYKKSGGILGRDGASGFRSRVRQSTNWVRKSRKKTDSGHERLYHCKTVQKATLIVHSPVTDQSANSYVFCVDDAPIAGGKTGLKSTHITTAVSKKDKTSTRVQDVTFVKFSEAELSDMRTRMKYGDGFGRLELEREA